MLIAHTSDWHLGRTLHGEDLLAFQAQFHDFLLDTVKQRGVDVLVIPGDVYDRAIPPTAAVELLDETLRKLAEVCRVVITPGNHDSATRLGFGRKLLREGLHVISNVNQIAEPVRVADEFGTVLFFGIPYLVPDSARYQLAPEPEHPLPRSNEAVTRAAMDQIRSQLAAEKLAAEKSAYAGSIRSVVLSHSFVTGGSPCESERDVSVGGVDSVSAQIYGGVDYVALGHLHGHQDLSSQMDDGTRLVYSGSPLPYSFSEKNHRKSITLVNLGKAGVEEIERVDIPQPRKLVEISGSLEEILAAAPKHGGDWVRAIITSGPRTPDLNQQIRKAYPHALKIEYRAYQDAALVLAKRETIEQNPLQLLTEFYAEMLHEEPTQEEKEILTQALDTVKGSGE